MKRPTRLRPTPRKNELVRTTVSLPVDVHKMALQISTAEGGRSNLSRTVAGLITDRWRTKHSGK